MEITPVDTLPVDLLLLADESSDSVEDYIRRGRSFAAMLDGQIAGGYVLIHTRPFTAEIVNIGVRKAFQRRGIGSRLIAHAIETARAAGFRILEIGTGDTGAGQIVLYERCGFIRCGTDRDYFVKHYPAPIVENGVECRDMVRLRIELC